MSLQVEFLQVQVMNGMVYWVVIALLLVAGVVLHLYLSKARRRKAYENWAARSLELRAESDRLREQLKSRDKDLESIRIALKRQQTWLDQIKEMKAMNKLKDHAFVESTIESMLTEMQQSAEITDKQKRKADHLDEIGYSFQKNLLGKHPDLSPAEIELCDLLRLKMTTNEIAKIRMISKASVRKAKYRLKKQLQLHADESVETYLQAL